MSTAVQGPESGGIAATDDPVPADYCDPVIEAHKKDVDRTLLRENLKLTVEERYFKFQRLWELANKSEDSGPEARPEE